MAGSAGTPGAPDNAREFTSSSKGVRSVDMGVVQDETKTDSVD